MEIISGERLQNLADIAIIDNGNPNNMQYSKQYFNIQTEHITQKINLFINANIIYVKTDYLNFFEHIILPHLVHKFILMTHNSDYKVGSHHMEILNNNKLFKWYGQNIDITHPKLFALPIGIANSQWAHGKLNLLEEVLIKTKEIEKINLVYVNFNTETNPQIREPVKKLLMLNGYKFTSPNLPWKNYLYDLSTYKFAICPEGNGPDCHRLWECLYLGVIPIVKKTVSFEQFSDLPILFVTDWNQITNEFLENQYQLINIKEKNLDKLHLSYWEKLINLQL